MNKRAKISVILLNLGCAEQINKAIESVLCQSFVDFELIIIHDLAVDYDACKISHSQIDRRIKTIKSRESSDNSWKIGLNYIEGDFIAIMDAKSIMHVDRLRIQYDFLKKNPFICVGSQGGLIDNDDNLVRPLDRPTDPELLKISLLKEDAMLHSSILISKSFFLNSDLSAFDKCSSPYTFYEWMAGVSSNLRFINLPDRLIYNRLHENEKSSTIEDIEAIRRGRLKVLKGLGIVPNKRDTYIYNHLMDAISLTTQEIQLAISFLNKILRRNLHLKIYSEERLFNFFQSTLNDAYQRSKGNFWSLDNDVYRFLELTLSIGKIVLEFGSGNGTDQLLKRFRVISIEHDFRFILKRARQHKIYYAPIANGWYEPSKVTLAIRRYKPDFIIVDGPPQGLRKGILSNLNLFSEMSCPFLFDDVNRSDDFSIMKMFCEQLKYNYRIIKGRNKSFAYCEKII